MLLNVKSSAMLRRADWQNVTYVSKDRGASETSATIYRSTRRNTQQHRCDNHKSKLSQILVDCSSTMCNRSGTQIPTGMIQAGCRTVLQSINILILSETGKGVDRYTYL